MEDVGGSTNSSLTCSNKLSVLTRYATKLFYYWPGSVIKWNVILIIVFPRTSDSDLHMTALALELCCTLMSDRRSGPAVGLTVRNKVLPQALTLVKSSLLQGQALLVPLNPSLNETFLFHVRRVCFIPNLLFCL